MRWAGHVTQMREKMMKLERNIPLGRLRHRLLHSIKMDLREIGWRDMDWIHVAQDRMG
jgi:phosphoribosyl-dephospho-CoA transferase